MSTVSSYIGIGLRLRLKNKELDKKEYAKPRKEVYVEKRDGIEKIHEKILKDRWPAKE